MSSRPCQRREARLEAEQQRQRQGEWKSLIQCERPGSREITEAVTEESSRISFNKRG